MSTEALEQLESRIEQVVDLLSRAHGEKQNLLEKIQQLKRNLEEVTRESKHKDQLIKRLRGDRVKVRSRVESILERVVTLEQPSQS